MNKPWSIAVGWTSLTLAAGIAYYFAKKDIKARHRERIMGGEDKLKLGDNLKRNTVNSEIKGNIRENNKAREEGCKEGCKEGYKEEYK
ncbi:hypothetical protein T552_01907 [Pneumocystis carinii B80]|uniref:Uncharacterized protein n=1 Tax=Pneumocystis carinii (strain B80) TaxID=1408658 RepID=A0A0W4ZI41_PNEC8|nr:hypothetical protein T552_01907 [Pneumocystis carinii B80]KTW28045.1 hypothetical protein T552_01907 [Pneumocystis carinii B80]